MTQKRYMRRQIFIILSSSLLLSHALIAQTKVERYDASKLNNNNVVYALPITKLYATVQVKELRCAPGPLALYANKCLGITNAIQAPEHYFTLNHAQVGIEGVANANQRYSIRLNEESLSNFVTLTEDGRLCSINRPFSTSYAPPRDSVLVDTRIGNMGLSVMSEEYVQATTLAKKADIAAQEIYRTRESRVDVLSGNSDQPFADGAAMRLAISGLDRREKALTRLFIGERYERILTKVIHKLPVDSTQQVVAFRFSNKIGLLPAEDLRGEPVYLSVEILQQAPVLSDKEQRRLEKRLKGIVYCIPGRARVALSFRGEVLCQSDIDVAQLGSLAALDPALFNYKESGFGVTFYPATGAVHRISEIETK